MTVEHYLAEHIRIDQYAVENVADRAERTVFADKSRADHREQLFVAVFKVCDEFYNAAERVGDLHVEFGDFRYAFTVDRVGIFKFVRRECGKNYYLSRGVDTLDVCGRVRFGVTLFLCVGKHVAERRFFVCHF